MGSTELAANLFRATQTEEKLRRDAVDSKQLANKTHYDVGQKVRQTIKDLGGTMPEALPSRRKVFSNSLSQRKIRTRLSSVSYSMIIVRQAAYNPPGSGHNPCS